LVVDSLLMHIPYLEMTTCKPRYDLKCTLSQARKIVL
jgi:hypothetical protein